MNKRGRKPGIHTRLGEITPWDRAVLTEVARRIQISISTGGDAATTMRGIPGYRGKVDWDRIQRLCRLGLIERCKPSIKWRLTPEGVAAARSERELIIHVMRGRFDAQHRWHRRKESNPQGAVLETVPQPLLADNLVLTD